MFTISSAHGISRRRLLFLALLAGLLIASGLTRSSAVGRVFAEPLADTELQTTWTFQGRVYDGVPFDETRPLENVTVLVYGSNNPYASGGYGAFIRSDTTDEHGYWEVPVYDDDGIWEYYHLREVNPTGYHSVDATTVDGAKLHNDAIAFEWPLTGQNLTGNKFWDLRDGSETATPTASATPEPTPTITATTESTSTASATPQPTNTRLPDGTDTPSATPSETTTAEASATPTPTDQGPTLGPVGFPEADWPWYAQEEISVHPEPPIAGGLTRLCAYVINSDPVNDHQVTLEFRVANFGIGIPFATVGDAKVNVPAGGRGDGCVIWTPPVPGHWCVEVVLHQEGYPPQRSQRNLDLDEPLRPGVAHARVFPVGNPFLSPVTITLGLVPHVEGWGMELSQDVLVAVQPGETRDVTLTVTPPDGQPLPGSEQLVVDVEAYVEGELIGGFRKVFRPPVPLHRFPDPTWAEREITIHPYPVRVGEPTEICVELRNPTDEAQDVVLWYAWANLGIGLEFAPINGPRSVHLPPHSIVNECLHWIPPVGGNVCIEARLEMEGFEPQISRRNIDADEPLEPGVSHARTISIRNPLGETVDVSLELIPHQPDWGLELFPDMLQAMEPGETREVTLTVTPPEGEPLPDDGALIVDVVARVGEVEIGGIRKVFHPPVAIHRPKDPVYAESEIGIDPYPLLPGQATTLSVELRNPTDTDQVVLTTFSVAPFGIGLPFSENHIAPNPLNVFVPAHGAARAQTTWTPPDFSGKFCVQVTLELEGHDQQFWSQRNIDVGEPLRPGEPHALAFELGTGDHQQPVTVTLGVINHRPGWDAAVRPDLIANVAPGQPVAATLIVTPSLGAVLGTGAPIVDVEAFVEGVLVGGFRKLDIPPIPLHKPHEKRYAESEIVVAPYPPQVGQISVISTTLQNAGDVPVAVNLEFGWANFGMGIPFTTTGMDPITSSINLAPGAETVATSDWTPSQSGHQCVQVRLSDAEGLYEPQVSQRNVDVEQRPDCDVTKVFTFTVYNDSSYTVTVDIGMITFNVPNDWEVTTQPTGSVEIGPQSEAVITVMVKIPCPVTGQALRYAEDVRRLQSNSGSVPIIDVEGYIGGEPVGGIEIRFAEAVTPEPVGQLLLPLISKGGL